MAENGTLLANRGDTGGAAIHLRELPSYAPKAFIGLLKGENFGKLVVKVSDEEVAAVLNYIRNAWGNRGAAIQPLESPQPRSTHERMMMAASTSA